MSYNSLQEKPTYPNAFHWIAGLPSEMHQTTVGVLIWLWKYSNSQEGHPHYGKAWLSQQRLANDMHLSVRTVQRALEDAWNWGAINREHVFKIGNQSITSCEPLDKKKRRLAGLSEHPHYGEHIGTRYWLNWDFIRELQSNGPDKLSPRSPIGSDKMAPPPDELSPNVLIDGFLLAPASLNDCDVTASATDETPSGALSSGEAEAGAGTARAVSECSKSISTNLPTPKNGRMAGGLNENLWVSSQTTSQRLCPDTPLGEFPPRPSFENQKRPQEKLKPKIEPADLSCVILEDLRTVWMQEQDSGLNRHGWKPTAENIGLREELRNAGLLNRKDLVLPAFRRFIQRRCCDDEAPIHAPLAIFRDEFQVWVNIEAKDHQAERDWHHQKELRRAEKVKRIIAEDAECLAADKDSTVQQNLSVAVQGLGSRP